MLGEYNRNKENTFKVDLHTKDPQNLVHTTINGLKEEIATLKVERINVEKKYVGEVELLKLELGEYKKKLSVLTDKYLAETFARESQGEVKSQKDYEQLMRESDIMYQQ